LRKSHTPCSFAATERKLANAASKLSTTSAATSSGGGRSGSSSVSSFSPEYVEVQLVPRQQRLQREFAEALTFLALVGCAGTETRDEVVEVCARHRPLFQGEALVVRRS
jgi:hypothetical protein